MPTHTLNFSDGAAHFRRPRHSIPTLYAEGLTAKNIFDIKLLKNSDEIQPYSKVTIKIPYDDENAKVYRIEEDGTLTDMKAEYKEGCMVFETDHSSLYVLAVPRKSKLGDVNGDGVVTIDDATLIQRYIADLDSFTPGQKEVAEVNNDGIVNVIDATTIQKYVAEIITDLR